MKCEKVIIGWVGMKAPRKLVWVRLLIMSCDYLMKEKGWHVIGVWGCFPIHQPREALSQTSPVSLRPINDFTLAIEMKNDFPLVIISTHTSSLKIPLARSFSIRGKSEGAADCVYKFSFCIRQSRQSNLLWNRTDGQRKKVERNKKKENQFLCSPHRSRFHGNRQFISLIAYPLASSGSRAV